MFNTSLNPRLGKRERLTVSSTAVPLTVSAYTIAATAGATKDSIGDKLPKAAVLQVFTDSIYYSLDGTTPSSTVGFQAAAGDYIFLDTFQKVKNFRAIRVTTDATVEVLPLYGN